MPSELLQIGDLVTEFTNVATTGPVPAFLMLVGGLLVAVSMGVFGGLAIGGVVSALTRP